MPTRNYLGITRPEYISRVFLRSLKNVFSTAQSEEQRDLALILSQTLVALVVPANGNLHSFRSTPCYLDHFVSGAHADYFGVTAATRAVNIPTVCHGASMA